MRVRMSCRWRLLVFFGLLLGSLPGRGADEEARWIRVGAAKLDVTPDYPIILAGYGSRTVASEGVDDPVWARALVIGSEDPAIVVAVDNCGVPGAMVERVYERVGTLTAVSRARFVVCSTHTHCAPTLAGYAPLLWEGRATAEQMAAVDRYTTWLEGRLVEVVRDALAARRDCRLAWGQGRVTFAGNRRVLDAERQWIGFGFQADGPVDHSLPLLVATDRDGGVVATWASYACHCTTQGARNHISPDWAGYANAGVESDHAGAVALTTIGCGADANPEPRGDLALAKTYGATVAGEVARLLGTDLAPLPEPPRAKRREVRLPFAPLPDREEWEARAAGGSFAGRHARGNLARLERGEPLPTHLEYPITTWTFGDDLAVVFLAGEVVVDYALRLKRELDWRRLWINGWANDVPCYIPSKRVLAEGGYEADHSQIYYDRPTRFAPAVEDLIIEAVVEMTGPEFAAPEKAAPSPFHRHPRAAVQP